MLETSDGKVLWLDLLLLNDEKKDFDGSRPCLPMVESFGDGGNGGMAVIPGVGGGKDVSAWSLPGAASERSDGLTDWLVNGRMVVPLNPGEVGDERADLEGETAIDFGLIGEASESALSRLDRPRFRAGGAEVFFAMLGIIW